MFLVNLTTMDPNVVVLDSSAEVVIEDFTSKCFSVVCFDV